MKAIALSPERVHQLTEMPAPLLHADEVLVRPAYCGICGSDLHAADIALFRPGVIVGHEFSGVIVDVGADVDGWHAGQKVVINPNGNLCGACAACASGRFNQCKPATQERCIGVARDGGMAELVALHPSYLNAVPDALDLRRAAWVEPLAVAVRSVRTSGAAPRDTAVVIGGGPIGQLVLQLLRAAGVRPIALVELSGFRAGLGLMSGAEETMTPAELEQRLTAGTMAEPGFVFECSGHPSSLQAAVRMVASGGVVRLVGMPSAPVTFDAALALMKEVRILTGWIYLPEEFSIAIEMLANGAVDVDPLTTSVLPLHAFDDALAALRQPEGTMKVLIRMTADAVPEPREAGDGAG